MDFILFYFFLFELILADQKDVSFNGKNISEFPREFNQMPYRINVYCFFKILIMQLIFFELMNTRGGFKLFLLIGLWKRGHNTLSCSNDQSIDDSCRIFSFLTYAIILIKKAVFICLLCFFFGKIILFCFNPKGNSALSKKS